MIKNLKLKNFRNFEDLTLDFSPRVNFIIGENGKGKTNILEAINLLCSGIPINKIPNNLLVKQNSREKAGFIGGEFNAGNLTISITENKKSFFIDKAKTTQKKFLEFSNPSVVFSPMTMNLLYNQPSDRRDFIDNILSKIYPEYKNLKSNYDQIVKNRNKTLKNIRENKSEKKELNFWQNKIIDLSIKIYKYRNNFNNYIKNNLAKYNNIFTDFNKNYNIKYNYITKVDLSSENNIRESISNYFKINRDRDIIIGRTSIGPHNDNFEINILENIDENKEENNIIHFASRGEIKSVIIMLKFIELDYLEEKLGKKAILLIDDLFSELDAGHQDLLLNKISNNQTIISSIIAIDKDNNNTIKL
ncbi:MAG: DNA replication and repair protein RecF [Candidatus Gracilibacteria bacterium]|nr:DNA replication and repair protein RecF [Candidatus Gracilibacteria bacterium]